MFRGDISKLRDERSGEWTITRQFLKRCIEMAPLIAEVEKRVARSWARLWDTALNFGLQHTS